MGGISKTLIENNEIDKNLKIKLSKTIITILIYRLNTMGVDATSAKMKSCYSGSIGYLVYGRYEERKQN